MPTKIKVYRILINGDQLIKKYPIDPDGKIIIKVGGFGRGNFSYKPPFDTKAVFNCGIMKLSKAVNYYDGADTLVLPPLSDGTQNPLKVSFKAVIEFLKSEGLRVMGTKPKEEQLLILINLIISGLALFFILNMAGIFNV